MACNRNRSGCSNNWNNGGRCGCSSCGMWNNWNGCGCRGCRCNGCGAWANWNGNGCSGCTNWNSCGFAAAAGSVSTTENSCSTCSCE